MRELPVADPGDPDTRSAGRYLFWLVRCTPRTVTMGILWASVWMTAQALVPAVVGRAVDAVAVSESRSRLLGWCGVLLALAVVMAVSGILRHRNAVHNFLDSSYRTVQLTTRQASRLGAALPKRVAPGEVVGVGTADIDTIGQALDILARGGASVVTLAVVAALLLGMSTPLGLLILLGVPLLMGLVALLLRPLHRRQNAYRDLQGALADRAVDIASGLRVLRGIGGESTFAKRYRGESGELRRAGVRTARVESILEAAEFLVPGFFIAVGTWLAAHLVLDGKLTIGQMVAFYGYAAFLTVPLSTLTEAADKITKGHVACRRVVKVLNLEPAVADPAEPIDLPATGDLVDSRSGLSVRPGRLIAIASGDPAEATALADRLGRYTDAEVTYGDVPLDRVRVDDVRRRILVAHHDAALFAGPLGRELTPGHSAAVPDTAVAPRAEAEAEAAVARKAGSGTGTAPGTAPGADRLAAAVSAACADDVIDTLDDGFGTEITARGRDFSGGQVQRLRLARALLADPEVLVLVEPTSAVDAHTEARIAANLRDVRRGRTTVVVTTSPLVLDVVDEVAHLEDGKVTATGPHRALLTAEPRYAALVTRGEEDAT